jgi:superfamily II DNA/RNA helicase
VLIATPGRLLDQFERGKVLLGGVTILVIDEADRMLDMGFMPVVERIVNLVSKRRQTLMFSATMPGEIRRLASAFLTHPKEVQATPPATMAERIDDHFAVVPPRQKFKALRRLIDSHDVGNALIFCNRKREVASLRRQMERAGLSVRDIHGDLDQAQRSAALDAFKRGEIAYLVATDVAARGLDIAMLPCVINYDVPTHADDYVHRIGRTGRAGQEGRAFTLVLPDERRYVDAIARLTGKEIPRLEITGMESEVLAEEAGRRGARPRRGRAATAPAPKVAAPAAAIEEVADEGVPAAAEAAPAAAPRAVSQAEAGAEPRSRSSRSGRRGRGRSEAKLESATAARPAAPLPAKPRSRGAAGRPAEPVVGMGDHVPLFMRRPVPQIATLPEPVED